MILALGCVRAALGKRAAFAASGHERETEPATKSPIIVPFAVGCIRVDDGAFVVQICEAVVFTIPLSVRAMAISDLHLKLYSASRVGFMYEYMIPSIGYRFMVRSTLTGFVDQPQIGTVQNRLDTLTDAAVTGAYFRRMHELQAVRDPQNDGSLTKLVAWVARGVKLFR